MSLPKRRVRRYYGLPTVLPECDEWRAYLQAPGKDGGCSANIITSKPSNRGDDFPLAPDVQRFARMFPARILCSGGGGRGDYASVSGFLPDCIKNKFALQHPPSDFFGKARRDLQLLLTGLRKASLYKAAPPWALPVLLWKILLLGSSRHGIGPVHSLRRILWLLFVCTRRAGRAPFLWQLQFLLPLDKHNGKKTCARYRLIGLMDFLGKAWIRELCQQKPARKFDFATGFTPHRRKEEAVLIHRLLQERTRSLAAFGLCWFFEKQILLMPSTV